MGRHEMGRIRTIKPDFFRHEELFQAEIDTGLPLRVAFAGLWTVCDREGRFRWRPRQLKLDVLPYDDVDFSRVLEELAHRLFVCGYEIDAERFGFIPTWRAHQVINMREAKSVIPEPPASVLEHVHACARTCLSNAHISSGEHMPVGVNVPASLRETVFARDGRKCVRCGAVDDLTIDHIFSPLIGGTHAITNLRCLCRPCNSRRPVQGEGLLADLAQDGLTLDDMERMCMHVQARKGNVSARGEGEGEREREGNNPICGICPDKPAKTPRAGGGVLKNGNGQHGYTPEFEEFWRLKPKRAGTDDKIRAFRAWNARLKEGKHAEAIIANTLKWAAYSDATEQTGTQFVLQAATYLGPAKHYENDWRIDNGKRKFQTDITDDSWLDGLQRG